MDKLELFTSLTNVNMRKAVSIYNKAVKDTRIKASVAQIRRAYESGNRVEVFNQIDFEIFEDILMQLNEELFKASTKVAFNTMGKYKADFETDYSAKYIREYTGILVREISEETQRGLREIIERAYTNGDGVDIASKNIYQFIGLTRRQSLAVDNYYRSLIQSGEDEEKAHNLSTRYYNRLREYRAENIARTEILKASNYGDYEANIQAMNAGYIDSTKYVRKWVLSKDDRLCEYCKEMNGDYAEIQGFFQTPFGQIEYPPLHPQCRCTTIIVPRPK